MNRYHTVVMMEAEGEATLAPLMDKRDVAEIAKYLSQWDYGDRDDRAHELGRLPDYDRSLHHIPYVGKYLLLCHWGLGTAMLLDKCSGEDCCPD